MSGQVWGTKMHAELRRPLFFSQAPHGPSSMVGTEEILKVPSSIGELNRLQADYNRRISRFLEAHFTYQICGPTVFVREHQREIP
jgi:hypothetical protein